MVRRLFSMLVLSLVLFCCVSSLFAETLVAKTEHFDIIYEEESAEMAKRLYDCAEKNYQDLVTYFKRDPGLHLPVYITREHKAFNAYATLYPYTRIVLFDTVPDYDIGLSNATDTIEFVFSHELTHAFTMNMRGKGIQFLAKAFGDPISVTSFYEYLSFVEGIAVNYESSSGGGRLNDPLSTIMVKQAVLEGKELTYKDAAGYYDIYPSGNIPYMFGGSFLDYVENTYGQSRMGELFSAYGELRFSTTSNTFRKITGVKLKTAWNDFLKSVAVPTKVKTSDSISSYGRYAKLTMVEDEVYGISSFGGTLFRLTERNEEEKLFSNGVSTYVVSASPTGHFLLGAGTDKEEQLRLFSGEGKILHLFKGAREGVVATLHGEEVYVLYGADSQKTYLKVYGADFEERGVLDLGYGVLGGDFTFLEDGRVLFVLSHEGTEHLALLDLETLSLLVADNEEGLEFSSLTSDGKGTGTFGYVYKEDLSSLSKYGEVQVEGDTLVFRLSPVSFNGGVYYPVKKENGTVYYISRYFDGQRLSRARIEEMGLESPIEEVLHPWATVQGNADLDALAAVSKSYQPLSYMKKGYLFPLGATTDYGFYDINTYGYGFIYYTMDPTEKHQMDVSFGIKDDFSVVSSFGYKYNDLFGLYGSSSTVENQLVTEVDAQVALSVPLPPGAGTLQAVETIGYVQEGTDSRWMNDISLVYENTRKVDMGRYNVFGFGLAASFRDQINLDFSDTETKLSVLLYLPKLLPIRSTPSDTYNLPLALEASAFLYGDGHQTYAWDGKLYLYNHELLKSLDLLSLFVRNVTVYGYGFGYYDSSLEEPLGQQYSLCTSVTLTPVIGEVGASMTTEVGGAISWIPGAGFSIGYILSLSL